MFGAVLSILGGVLGNFLSNIVKMLGEYFIVKKLGEDDQAIATEAQTNVLVNQAAAARAAVVPLTPVSLQNIKPGTDPDFRD